MNIEKQTNYPAFENRDYYVDLGEHICYYRKRANVTQQQLANKIHVTRAYLSRIENSNHSQPFSLDVLFNISRALEVPVKYFFEPFPEPDKLEK